ncbi:uncharacterized protein LOC141649865 [Silene latifolia]|uniref:uncharacterized protein LOC141649865 n=1 Tax=Silene latifolia TaxID=37657 RepID=UPI003D782A02
MKNSVWSDYQPSAELSWHWRKVCSVRDLIKEGFIDGQWSIGSGDYTVKSCYEWIRDKKSQIEWYRSIWCPMAQPKHSFISWLVSHQALMLKDKLMQFQVVEDDLCHICQLHSETHSHLMETCQFSQSVLQLIGGWLGTDLQHTNILNVIAGRRWSRLRKNICNAAILACWYMIWMQRNGARIHGRVSKPARVALNIQRMLQNRFIEYKPRVISTKDSLWLYRMQFL